MGLAQLLNSPYTDFLALVAFGLMLALPTHVVDHLSATLADILILADSFISPNNPKASNNNYKAPFSLSYTIQKPMQQQKKLCQLELNSKYTNSLA